MSHQPPTCMHCQRNLIWFELTLYEICTAEVRLLTYLLYNARELTLSPWQCSVYRPVWLDGVTDVLVQPDDTVRVQFTRCHFVIQLCGQHRSCTVRHQALFIPLLSGTLLSTWSTNTTRLSYCFYHRQTDRILILWPYEAHCCGMGTAIKHPVPDRVKPSIVITSGHSDAQP